MSRFLKTLRSRFAPRFRMGGTCAGEEADTRAETFDLLLPDEAACLQTVFDISACHNLASAHATRMSEAELTGGLSWHLALTFYLEIRSDDAAHLRCRIANLAIEHGGRMRDHGLQAQMPSEEAA